MVQYKQFKSGQKVKNKFDQILTVLFQQGCQVFVEDNCLHHYHPNNLYLIDKVANNLNALKLSHQH